MVFASVAEGDYVFTNGQAVVKRVRSSSFGHRAFCGECGTPLYMKVNHQPETVDFSVATLDEPGRVRPGFHIFWSNRVSWLKLDDGLPKFEKFRPDTRGLEGSEPPT